MDTALLLLLAAISFGLCAWGFLRVGRVYQYPFLAGVVFTCWLLPQALGLLNDVSLPQGGYETAMIVAILCAIALWLGFTWSARPLKALNWKFDTNRLLFGALFLSVLGASFTLMLGGLSELELQGQMWSGTAVAYHYLAQTQYYGLALAALIYAKSRSKFALLICLFDLSFFGGTIILAGRRTVAVKAALIILIALWFARRFAPPRPLIAGGIILAMLFVTSIGHYRALTGTGAYGGIGGALPTWEALSSIDFLGNVKSLAAEGAEAHELRNAIHDVAATQITGDYNLGKWYWNGFIFTAIPAQIVGRELKDSLTFDLPNAAFDVYQFQALIGGTHTFVSDTFQSFWYFGALVFFLIGRMMSALYHAAMNGHTFAQVAYMVSIVDGLIAITHESVWYFTPWVFFFIFMLPVLIFARLKPQHRHASPLRYAEFGSYLPPSRRASFKERS